MKPTKETPSGRPNRLRRQDGSAPRLVGTLRARLLAGAPLF